MKYLRADVTILMAAMVGGLIALGSVGGQLRAAADLGYGRHSMPWCTEHLGMADDRGASQASQSPCEPALTEGGQNDAPTAGESPKATASGDSGMDYEHNHPFYGREGLGAYGREMTDDEYTGDSSSADSEAATSDAAADETETSMEEEASSQDNYEYQPEASDSTETPESSQSSAAEAKAPQESTSDASWRYEYSYPESRYGYGLEAQAAPEPAAEAETGEEPSDENVSSYQESRWEEKYGNAEEMSGRASDEKSANAEERADEPSNAEMESADQSASDAEQYTLTRGSGVEANEKGTATESAGDGEPNEADLDKGQWMPSENNDPVQNEAQPAEGLERFGYLPSHLLIRPDQELLRELRRLADQSPGEREEAFRQYVESLGSEAIEFAAQYQNATGEEAAMLSDDIASSATLLAVYRLYEQGELGIDEAIDLLRRTLDNLSQEWIDGVNEITAESAFSSPQAVNLEDMTDQASASVPRALWGVVSSWASQRAGQWKTALYGVWTRELSILDWQALISSALANVDSYHLD